MMPGFLALAVTFLLGCFVALLMSRVLMREVTFTKLAISLLVALAVIVVASYVVPLR